MERYTLTQVSVCINMAGHYFDFHSFEFFLRKSQLVVFHKNLSDSKSHQVFRNHLSILADVNNTVICMISILPLLFNSSRLFPSLLEPLQEEPITNGITVTFILYSFFLKQIQIIRLSFSFLS